MKIIRKKYLIKFLVLTFLASLILFPSLVKAEKATSLVPLSIGRKQGDASVNLILNLSKGTVVIYGSGEMDHNVNEVSRRWLSGMESDIKSVKIESGVTNISDFAFGGNGNDDSYNPLPNLKKVKIGNTVKSIGRGAFAGAKSLESIDIPSSVTVIKAHAFNMAESLSSVTLHEGLEKIENGAFLNCESLHSIIIPHGVISIERGVFDKNLKKIQLPKTLKEIKSGAFEGQINATIYSKDTTIEDGAFPPGSIITCYKDSLTERSALEKENLRVIYIKEKNSVIKSPKPSVQVKRKKLIIKCAAVSNAVGYQIRYSKNKSMKDAKVVNKRSYISKKMKPGTVYYVQARAYDTIIRDKIQGKWSKAVKVVIK